MSCRRHSRPRHIGRSGRSDRGWIPGAAGGLASAKRDERGRAGAGAPGVAAEPTIDDLPRSRVRVLLADFTTLLGQQMYFWGRDVLHPRGNLLCEAGFEKTKSRGLQGTSCYRKPVGGGGFVELHGACVGYYDPGDLAHDSFLYVRNRARCFFYRGSEPPAPGFYDAGQLHPGRAVDLYFASLNLLEWWLRYEEWIAEAASADWRDDNYQSFASLPASRPSLPPEEAVRWLRQYAANPGGVVRVRERMKSLERR